MKGEVNLPFSFRFLGRSKVTVELSVLIAVILYGSINLGTNFLALPFGKGMFLFSA